VVARGTARAIGSLSPYVAGKTGTTENSVDGWFVGFTNDVTVAVWVGYDNGDGKRRSLGPSEDGAKVALPIFEPIIESIWADNIAPKTPLSGPSPEARGQLVDLPIDYMTGTPVQAGGRGDFVEHFRIGSDGQVADTQYELVSQEEAEERQNEQTQQWTTNEQSPGYGQPQGWSPPNPFGSLFAPWGSNQAQQPQPQPQQQPQARGLFAPWGNQGYQQRQQPQQSVPNSFWGGQRYN
jgi:penicillin-binding protein 1A